LLVNTAIELLEKSSKGKQLEKELYQRLNALNSGLIRGAVLDVFKVEPLVKTNRLWYAPNLFMTPHCAD
jgi:phosphoglycerate dehydrogenase-like enzyme